MHILSLLTLQNNVHLKAYVLKYFEQGCGMMFFFSCDVDYVNCHMFVVF